MSTPPGAPPEIVAVAHAGLRVLPGLWRRRLVQAWGELVTLDDPVSVGRRLNLSTYGPEVYKLALRGRVSASLWYRAGAGRWHCKGPLLQQITHKFGLRDAIVPSDGHVFIDADWTSAHLWLCAGISKGPDLLADLETGHAYEAAAHTLLPGVDPTHKASRKRAKVAVLEALNGGGGPALSQVLGCSPNEALRRRAELTKRYPALLSMPTDWAWTTPLGRRVEVPDDVRAEIPSPAGWMLQSYEVDALHLALRRLSHRRVVFTLHDQVLVEAPIGEQDEIAAEVRAAMDAALREVTGLATGSPQATTKVEIKPSWSGVPPDTSIVDPGGPLELPSAPLGPDGPWSARDALQRVLDGGAEIVDLHQSPWLHHLADHEDLLERLSPKATAGRIRSASKAAAKAAASQARRQRQQTRDPRARRGGSEGDDLRAAIGGPADWPTYTIPMHWAIGEDRAIRRIVKDKNDEPVSVLVSLEPWYVLQSLREFDTGRSYVEIGFFHRDRWRRMAVPREVLRSTTKIVELAADGVDVRSTANKNAVDWAAMCEPRTGAPGIVTSRLGWHGDDYITGPGGRISLVDSHGDFARWGTEGSWEGWIGSLARLHEAPVIALALCAAATAPLLRFLDLDHNPIVDLSGPSCSGKTTALRVAGSGWGRPGEQRGGTLRTWSATLVGLERQAAAQWDVPLLVDDTARATKAGVVSDAIYALAQGKGKIRGSRDQGTNGGRQTTTTWRLSVISTGEAPIVDRTEAGGARARPLSITTTPACPSLELAQTLEDGVSDNHGHLAPRLAELAATHGRALRERHREALKWWAHGGGDTRMLSTAASIEVAAELLLELGVPIGEGWRDELAGAVAASRSAADQGGRALDVVREELSRNGDKYLRRACDHVGADRCGISTPRCIYSGEPHGGWRGVWDLTTSDVRCVGMFPQVLRGVLAAAGHTDPGPVLSLWRQQGVLAPGTHGGMAEPTVAGHKHRVYAFSRAVLGLS